MNKIVLVGGLTSLLLISMPIVSAARLDEKIDEALAFAEAQLEQHAQRTGPLRFTCYTDVDGKWVGRGLNGWCCGFSAGLMWMMYDYTGDEKWANYGRDWNDSIRSRATASDNDTGFQIFNAFGYALRHGLDALSEAEIRDYEGVLRWANETFTTQRYNAHVGGYRTWPPTLFKPYEGQFEINSDMVMNLELPIYVAKDIGNMELVDKVSRHADTTWEHTVFKSGDAQWESPESDEYVPRQHGSHWHVVAFDPTTGSVIGKRTEQGDKTESTWSRGQAWLVYGYAMLYRYTGYERMLERSEISFDYFMAALKAQSEGNIPYSDFDALVDELNPLDTSAAAIVASASIELYQITGDQKYLNVAENMLNDLTSPPYLASDMTYEAILTRGSWGYDDPEEVGTIFGDFYLVEAMLRYKEMKAAE
jgi:unsaturated chondroitin disaccharide hydrolase